MDTTELILLLGKPAEQLAIYEKAKAGDSQSMVDFVRLSVFKKIYDNDLIPLDKKIPTYESIMNMVTLTAGQSKEQEHGG